MGEFVTHEEFERHRLEIVTKGAFEEHQARVKESHQLIQNVLSDHSKRLDDLHNLAVSVASISKSVEHMVDDLKEQNGELKEQGRKLANIENTTANFSRIIETTQDQEKRIRELEKADGDKYKKIWASVWGAIIAGIIALGLSIFELKGIGG